MTFLSDSDIISLLDKQELSITPLDQQLIGSNFISLRLSTQGYRLEYTGVVDVASESTYPKLVPVMPDSKGRLALNRGEVLLISSLEKIKLSPKLMGFVDGTSDLAQLGISVVLSSNVAPGFGWNKPSILTLEILSHYLDTVYLYPHMRICKLLISTISSELTSLSKLDQDIYSGQTDTIGSQLFRRLYRLNKY